MTSEQNIRIKRLFTPISTSSSGKAKYAEGPEHCPPTSSRVRSRKQKKAYWNNFSKIVGRVVEILGFLRAHSAPHSRVDVR
jgi:hypothetical protein